jgi:uncharacterized protein YcfL
MKKFLIAFVGLLLMVTFGCSSEDTKEPAEKTKEAVMEAKDKTVEMANDAATATKETAVEVKDKAVEMGNDDAVKETKKKPAIEGC